MGNPPKSYWDAVERQWGYLGDRVYCHICYRYFRFLGGHIKKHRLSQKEYRDRFGIVYGLPLCSDDVQEMMRFHTLDNMGRGIIPKLPLETTPFAPNKGRIPAWQSEKARVSKMIGRLKSDEEKLNISNGLMGHYVSSDTKKKISVACMGRGKGVPLTEEHKKRISLVLKGKPKGE